MNAETQRYTIYGITCRHRTVNGIVCLIRFTMVLVLTCVGTSLLLKSPEFMSLLFDAVSLKFIIELQEIFYTNILRQRVKNQCDNVETMPVVIPGASRFHVRGSILDVLWLVVVAVASLAIMYSYYKYSVKPLG